MLFSIFSFIYLPFDVIRFAPASLLKGSLTCHRTVLWIPAQDLFSGFNLEAFPMIGHGRKASKIWIQSFPSLTHKISRMFIQSLFGISNLYIPVSVMQTHNLNIVLFNADLFWDCYSAMAVLTRTYVSISKFIRNKVKRIDLPSHRNPPLWNWM